MMDSTNIESQDKLLHKFTKILTLKVAQIVVQSRQGKKITHDSNTPKNVENGSLSSSPNLQWFNLSIPDEPDVTNDTKRVLNGELADALANVLCIEILLKTSDGDEMVLEMWTVKLLPECDKAMNSLSTIYYRMSILLKSTLSISRITPGYKMSRAQHKETYKIYHKIYGGPPNLDLLGDKNKKIKVAEMAMSIGTILIEVVYRTKMTILPAAKPRHNAESSNIVVNTGDIMVKSDHFPSESPKKNQNQQIKKELDLSRPLTAGAFVDVVKIKELHDTLSQKLPPEPSMTWLLAEKEKVDDKMKVLSVSSEKPAEVKPGSSAEASSSSGPTAKSKAIEVPKAKNGDKYSSLMEFPFADGSPITELANFYQECLQARSAASDEWTEILGEVTASTDSDSLSQQLKMFEDAVPEFDNMVASMFSNSDHGSES